MNARMNATCLYVRVVGNAAAVDHSLSVVLASVHQISQLEQAIGGRIKAQIANALCQGRIGDGGTDSKWHRSR